jgi:RHS repeat-associated protein
MAIRQPSTVLLGTDQNTSALQYLGSSLSQSVAYSPFGYHIATGLKISSGFNGQTLDRISKVYLLGNGYRAFSTTLQRLYSPDSLSPFSQGGINSYSYCAGDPVNKTDPSGHLAGWGLVRKNLRKISKMNLTPKISQARRALNSPVIMKG